MDPAEQGKPGLDLEEIFLPGGLLDGRLSHYEYRASQLLMARAVLQAIEDQASLCVEAGTGTGKTLSYLIPALSSRKRVIVSTATKALQEQILAKDLPFIREHLFPGLRATCMKGRQNYLCHRRFEDHQRQRWLVGVSGAEWTEQIRVWLQETSTGDRAEIPWLKDDDPLWDSVDARSDTCVGQKCQHFSRCFVTRMRQRALESDIIIVNHALFFANLALESDEIGPLLPEYGVLILDEAHDVEDVAADYFGARLSNYQIDDLIRVFRRSQAARNSEAAEFVDRLEVIGRRFFSQLPGADGRFSLSFYRDERSGRSVDLRSELAEEARHLQSILKILFHRLGQERWAEDDTEPLLRRIDRYTGVLGDLFGEGSPEHVYWYERSGRGVFLHLTPIRVAAILREKLFERSGSIVLTSATLTAGGSFSYIRERLGFSEAKELVVPGEFDYGAQAVLYVPRDIPEPGTSQYFHHLLCQIRAILELTDGHAFLLFTSIQQMQRVHAALGDSDYPLFCQGQKPKSQILAEFRSTPHSVLCATSSFWQGVDVQGEALQCVVIDKLPFQVPTEPLVSARVQVLRSEGRDPFLAYTVPSAIINLRQGLGRLIRSREDRGILAVLDRRLWSRRYGNLFFNSLPKCPVADNMKTLENFFSRIVSS